VSFIPFHAIDVFDNADDKYWMYNHLISDVINDHAPLKTKFIKGRNAPHMNSELKSLMYKKRMAQNAYWKYKGSNSLWDSYRKIRNEFVRKSKLSRQEYFRTKCQNGAKDQTFWQTIKPYITDKDGSQSDIILKEGDDLITCENDIANVFNEYFKYITEHIGFCDTSGDISIDDMLRKFEQHESIKLITENCNTDEVTLKPLTVQQVHKILSKVNPKKSTGYDNFPPKLLYLARNEFLPSITNLINNTITNAQFPKDLKLAEISPCFKKGNPLDKTKYRPVSILPCISKVVESAIDMQISDYFYSTKAGCLSAYRKMYNTQSVLIRAIEDWKNALDEGKYCGAILMDLSKAFDVIPHDLMLAEMNAYGFDRHCIELISNYLSDRYQRTKINQARSKWMKITKGVPQGSILGPTLFNIFINDMLFCVKDYGIYNYADDNTVSYICSTSDELSRKLEMSGDKITDWFSLNGMQANPEKYQSIVFGSKEDLPKSFTIKGQIVQCADNVRLLGVDIDRKLSFNTHISELCKKASRQINAVIRLTNVLDSDVKEIIYQSFIRSTFSYCPVVWMFSGQTNIKKLDKLQCRALRFVYNEFDIPCDDLLRNSKHMSISTFLKYALCIEVFKCVNDMSPDYLCTLFETKTQPYNMRDNYKVIQKNFRTITYGFHSFTYYGAKLWNELPVVIKCSNSIDEFKGKLKMYMLESC